MPRLYLKHVTHQLIARDDSRSSFPPTIMSADSRARRKRYPTRRSSRRSRPAAGPESQEIDDHPRRDRKAKRVAAGSSDSEYMPTDQVDADEDESDEEDADELAYRPKRLKALLGANLYFSRDYRIKGTYDSILRSMAHETNCDLAGYLFYEAQRSLDVPPSVVTVPPGPTSPDEASTSGGGVSPLPAAQVTSADTTPTSTPAPFSYNEMDNTRHPAYQRAMRYWTRFPLRPDDVPSPEWSLADEILALRDRFSADLHGPHPSLGGEDGEGNGDGDGDDDNDDEEHLSDLDAPDSLDEPLVSHVSLVLDNVLRSLFEWRQAAMRSASKRKKLRRPAESPDPLKDDGGDKPVLGRQAVLEVLETLAKSTETKKAAAIPTS
jgi:hypothetical protein